MKHDVNKPRHNPKVSTLEDSISDITINENPRERARIETARKGLHT